MGDFWRGVSDAMTAGDLRSAESAASFALADSDHQRQMAKSAERTAEKWKQAYERELHLAHHYDGMSEGLKEALRAVADLVDEMSPELRKVFLERLSVRARERIKEGEARLLAEGLPERYFPTVILRDGPLNKRFGGVLF